MIYTIGVLEIVRDISKTMKNLISGTRRPWKKIVKKNKPI
jgi:alkylated DNA nucleotide flippase Atl1